MKNQITFKALVVIAAAFTFVACKAPSSSNNDIDNSGVSTASETMNEIRVPSSFNWKTYSDVEITIESDSTGIMQVVSKSGTIYYQANLNGNDVHSFKLPMPAYETEVLVKFRGQEVPLSLNSGTLNYSFI